ncbi:apolipoprotein N-acyltransferase [Hahella sp. CCB-MM4]|uniref:apolipoprotein N-acyltransferase n=1 Tax=Hahella sp. (strain CCB-MM4) TaxID=1926491 RepID=UPI000B9B3127|nr:apolipoprotein N-acyltransferase [Hahella sp. CCB-MM4]OZG72388.1 apolipoprotein N-acyltransferase [Hahella sp. CCB-MM4]
MIRSLTSIFIIPAVAGALLPFCFAPYDIWPLAFPAIFLLLHFTTYDSLLRSFAQGWSFGLGFFGVGVSWVYVSIHDHGGASMPLALALTSLFVAGIALFPALQFVLTAKLAAAAKKPLNITARTLLFISVWVLFEWVRSWFLTGFPWLYLGNAFIETPLAGWAPITGVYGVSLFILLTTAGGYLYWHYRQKKLLINVLLFIGLLWGSGALLKSVEWTKALDDPFTVSMVQANIPQDGKWEPFNRDWITKDYLDLTSDLWSSDLIIWPETALPYFQHQATKLITKLDQQAKDTNTTLAMGILSAEFDKSGKATVYNSFSVIGNGKGLYNKQKLVPFGEYVPLEDQLRGLIRFFNMPMSDMAKGSSEQSSLRYGKHRLMPLICYEVVYPDFVAEHARQAELLVTVSNDSWFGASIGPHQHLQIAQMRALETRKYMLRSTNNGITAIIDPFGNITNRAPQFERTTLTGQARLRSGETPFVITGSWPILILCALIAMGVLWRGRRAESPQLDREIQPFKG